MGYIISGDGFLKGIKNTPIKKEGKRVGVEVKLEWSKTIIGSKVYSSKQAKALINKYNINGFYWNPKVQYPIRDKWTVKQHTVGTNFYTEETYLVGEWYPIKMIGAYNSDLQYLMTGKLVSGYTREVAYEQSIERNKLMNEELENKISIQESEVNLK